MKLQEIASKAEELAREEIRKFNVPEMTHLDISIKKGIELAKKLNADVDIVKIGVCLMDIKLGQAFQDKRVSEHVKMSSDFTREFLQNFSVNESISEKIINCVEAHHGRVPYNSIEAEITANADCYRFISPKGIFFYFTVLGRRLGDDLQKIIETVELKMDEKMNIVSLPIVKEELEPIYNNMKEYFAQAKLD